MTYSASEVSVSFVQPSLIQELDVSLVIVIQPLSLPQTLLTFCPFLPPAIIEHVRDGSVVRALLLPDHYLVTVMLSGVKVTTTHLYVC